MANFMFEWEKPKEQKEPEKVNGYNKDVVLYPKRRPLKRQTRRRMISPIKRSLGL